MGEKRVSVRTLPSGERVTDFPPDAAHPEGHQELIRDRSPLRERLMVKRDKKVQRHQAIQQNQLRKIEIKRGRQQVRGFPPEKSPI